MPLPLGSMDMEGIALARDGTFYVASEGNVAAGASPWIAHFRGDGTRLSTLPLPPKLLPVGDPPRGVRQNLALESLTLTSGGAYYFPNFSSPSFPGGAQVYVYVDSINYATIYGNVQESNEGNNVFGPVVSTTDGQLHSAASSLPSREGLPGR